MEGLHRTSALFCAPEKTTVRQPILILSPCVRGSLGFQVLRSTSALFWAPEKVGVRQPILILSPFVWGSPRTEVLGRTSTLFWAPGKARVRQPVLLLSPFVWGRLSGSHAGQLFSSGFLWDMPPYVVYRVFYLYEFVLMSDKRESGEEGGKKRERKAVAEDPGKRIRLKREPKEEPKEAKDPEVKVEDEGMGFSSPLHAHAPAPPPAPAPAPPPDPPAPPAPIPAFLVDVFAHDMYDVRARRDEGNMSVVDLGDRPQGVIGLHLGVS